MCGAAASASAAATPAFTDIGIMRVLNGGDTNSHAAGAHQREHERRQQDRVEGELHVVMTGSSTTR